MRARQQGAVLVWVLVLAFALVLLGLGTAELSFALGAAARDSADRAQALALAETGIQEARWVLTNLSATWTGDSPVEHSLPGAGSYTIAVTNTDNGDGTRTATVKATGYVPAVSGARARRAVEARYTVTVGGGGGAGLNPVFNHAASSLKTGKEKIEIGGGSGATALTFNGSLHTNGDLEFKGGSGQIVSGTASVPTGKTIDLTDWTGTPYASSSTSAAAIGKPLIGTDQETYYRNNATLVVSGDHTLSGSFSVAGNVFVEGHLTISGTFTGKGYVFAKGNVIVAGSLANGNPDAGGKDQLNLIALGNVEAKNLASATVDAFLYANSNVDFDGSTLTVNGGMSAGANLKWKDATLIVNFRTELTSLVKNPNAIPDAAGSFGGGGGTNTATAVHWREVAP